MTSKPDSIRIAGLTAFAAATFMVSVFAIAALDRVGAPERLVRALGPILALIALGAIGIGSRTGTLAAFIAAGRRARPLYTALAVTAVAAGAALGLRSRFDASADPILLGAMIGVGFGAAGLGPLVRRFGGASLSDVVATRFPNPLVRAISGLASGAASALVAFAGYRTADAVAEALLTNSRPTAETIVAAALLASVASGGLASLVWCSAASGAGVGLIALICWALRSQTSQAVLATQGGSGLFLTPPTSPNAAAALIAAAIGAGCLICAAPPTAGCRDATRAMKSGLCGVLLFSALAFAGAPPLLTETGFPGTSPLADSLAGAATVAAALALAGLGVLGASRAFGIALARPPSPLATLASVRLARMRVAQAAVVIGCVVVDRAGALDPATALIGAMAIALAFTAPIAALAAIPRAGPLAATAAGLTVAGLSAGILAAGAAPPAATGLLEDALWAGAAAFAVGLFVALAVPRRGPAPTPGPLDPSSQLSG